MVRSGSFRRDILGAGMAGRVTPHRGDADGANAGDPIPEAAMEKLVEPSLPRRCA
jgi:hypothetical protein